MTDDGVWVTYYWDNGPNIVSVYNDETEALRAAVASNYQHVAFLPFGRDLRDVLESPAAT